MAERFVTVQLDINAPEIRALLERVAHDAFRAGVSACVPHLDTDHIPTVEQIDQSFADWLIYGPGHVTVTGQVR